ncbi:hypothetical protein C8J57DRAFT_274848 [Mycena rebaudengoi]|nr:hypothetical protein C8J57DRAFT_274848 [Mycena rebaudengoi]
MHNSQDQFRWYTSHVQPDIKVESLPESFSLLSPPSSPSLPPTVSNPRRRSVSGSSTSPKRVRPYPLPRENRPRIDSEMATTPAYWSSTSNTRGGSSRPTNNNDRRPLEGTQQPMYSSPYASMPMYSGRPSDSSDEHRSSSSSSNTSSSLTGAMGDTHVPHSRHSGSGSPPSPVRGGPGEPMFSMNIDQAALWGQPPMQPSFPGLAGNLPYMDPHSSGSGSYSAYRNPSPESLSPPSPFHSTLYNDTARANSSNYGATNATGYSSPPATQQEAEIRHLRKRVRDLEDVNERAREQLKALGHSRRSFSAGGLPSPTASPPTSASFQASWQARTSARVKQFCSLNRAGNALCAWHDSRRERRVYPPRMAPAGYLNCGCTIEEALFEESLSRHQVGSYLPGETVRMDPALRNPLLKLLQARYGYRDGDFERDPRTGDWVPGEGPAIWEQQIQAGAPNPRRERRS